MRYLLTFLALFLGGNTIVSVLAHPLRNVKTGLHLSVPSAKSNLGIGSERSTHVFSRGMLRNSLQMNRRDVKDFPGLASMLTAAGLRPEEKNAWMTMLEYNQGLLEEARKAQNNAEIGKMERIISNMRESHRDYANPEYWEDQQGFKLSHLGSEFLDFKRMSVL